LASNQVSKTADKKILLIPVQRYELSTHCIVAKRRKIFYFTCWNWN